MMTTLGYLALSIYIVSLSYILLYCLLQLHLLWTYSRKKGEIKAPPESRLSDFPFVTIQLPVFNERYVITRLLECISAMRYPRDRFEIQVLDDSTDDTRSIAARGIASLREEGFNIEHITRSGRTGYKAGALSHGMQHARGEYIAIFDADFLPREDFLLRALPFFQDPAVGAVQARWEHINEDYSLLTRLQAFQLNVHFTVEQGGRQAGGYLLQFNGTAGIWRREAILNAGGWTSDTLTEDLDLSYRAQLQGWKIRYLEELGAPAELPAEMNGLKSQQYRWMKGGAETAKKLLPSVWRSGLPLGKKIHASAHLLSSSVFIFVFLVGIFSVPLLFVLDRMTFDADYLAIFLIGLLSIGAVYYAGNVLVSHRDQDRSRSTLRFLILFVLFLSLSMGLSLHNALAVLQGYLGRKTAFVRTPKYGLHPISDSLKRSTYLSGQVPRSTIGEGILALYFLAGIIVAVYLGHPGFLLFHILLMFGYGTICYYSIRHLLFKA